MTAPTGPRPRGALGAGFRYSVYGPDCIAPPEYWGLVGLEMAKRFEGAVPETIWIVGRLNRPGTRLSFPIDAKDPLIAGTPHDQNEAILTLFDRLGFRVWLQVEPGFADLEEQIHLVMGRYAHHPSVIGFGIDVEWYRSTNPDLGQPVTDEEARRWLAAVREHGAHYRLFLKHFAIDRMPPSAREGILFVDDSQILPSLDAMVEEFAVWGRTFAPAPVAFQYGYESDRPWWIELEDPPRDVGQAILDAVPNTEGLYWVDFTVVEVFPPTP